jgi:hypothetical protein
MTDSISLPCLQLQLLALDAAWRKSFSLCPDLVRTFGETLFKGTGLFEPTAQHYDLRSMLPNNGYGHIAVLI